VEVFDEIMKKRSN